MKTQPGSLDTNVLLRFLLEDIEEQHQAVVALLRSGQGQFTVADTALVEVVFVLDRYYKMKRPDIARGLQTLLSLDELHCNRAQFTRALLLFIRHPSLSFEDCCLATYAELEDAVPLWTFDKKLAAKAPSARLVPMVKANKR